MKIKYIRIIVPVRYEDEQIPYDFPLRKGDVWEATIEIETGKIINWPENEYGGELYLKVVDEGIYQFLDQDQDTLMEISEDYVPDEIIPGEYGDYIKFDIHGGIIANWYDIETIIEGIGEEFEMDDNEFNKYFDER